MKRRTYILAFIALGTVAIAIGVWSTAPKRQARAADEPAPAVLPAPAEIVPLSPPKFVGARSCAATACHGSAEPDTRAGRIGRNEYVYWFEHDPHARAFRALSTPRGREMLARLGIATAGKVIDEKAYQNCLACHNLEPSPTERGENFFATEGVGCEACHGGAERWIAEHQRGGLSPSQKQSLGMKATENLTVRAELCVRCHVGSAEADVNHDLLAAGHPPLKFELAAYCEIYPKHWNDQAERQRTKSFELQLWLQGQFAAQRAALQVQAARATRATDKTRPGPWPEFANYNCFACHHDLRGQPYWRNEGSPGKPLAPWPAARWYSAAFDHAPLVDLKFPGLLEYKVQQRRASALLEQSLSPNADDFAAAANAALKRWDQGIGKWQKADDLPGHPHDIHKLLFNQIHEDTDWDTATQNYLYVAAYERSERDEAEKTGKTIPRAAERAALLNEIRHKLAFPPSYDSPQQFVGKLDDKKSPRSEVQTLFRRLSFLYFPPIP